MSISYRLIANTIFFLALFPYVTPFDTLFDVQPWALLVAVIFIVTLLLKGKFILPPPLFVMLIITLYAAAIYMLYLIAGESEAVEGFRSLSGYVSVFALAYVGFTSFRYVEAKPYIVAVAIWFLVAILHLFMVPKL